MGFLLDLKGRLKGKSRSALGLVYEFYLYIFERGLHICIAGRIDSLILTFELFTMF